MDALNECDVAIIREIIHPDAEWWVLGFGSFDRETLIAQLSDMLGAEKVKETKIIGTTAEGDRVAIESRGNFEFADRSNKRRDGKECVSTCRTGGSPNT